MSQRKKLQALFYLLLIGCSGAALAAPSMPFYAGPQVAPHHNNPGVLQMRPGYYRGHPMRQPTAVRPYPIAPRGVWQPAVRPQTNNAWPIPTHYRYRAASPAAYQAWPQVPGVNRSPAYYPPMPFPPRVAQQRGYIPPYMYPGMRPQTNFGLQFSPVMRSPQAFAGYPRSMPAPRYRPNPYQMYRPNPYQAYQTHNPQHPMHHNTRQWPRVSARYPNRPAYNQWRQPMGARSGAFRQNRSPYQRPNNRDYRPRGNFYPRHGARYPMPQPQHRQMAAPPRYIPQPYAESGLASNPSNQSAAVSAYGFKPLVQMNRYQPNWQRPMTSNYQFRPLPNAAPRVVQPPVRMNQRPDPYVATPYIAPGSRAALAPPGYYPQYSQYPQYPQSGFNASIQGPQNAYIPPVNGRYIPYQKLQAPEPQMEYKRGGLDLYRSHKSVEPPLVWRPKHNVGEAYPDAPQFAYSTSPLQ